MTVSPIDGDRDKARHLERASIALTVHRTGGTWEQAAKAAGYGAGRTAYRAVMAYLSRNATREASLLREEANTRHAQKIAMLEDVMYDLDQPLEQRLRASAEHTRAEARHARLNGLDAPVQVALSAGVSAQLADALAEVREVVSGTVTEVHDETPPALDPPTDHPEE